MEKDFFFVSFAFALDIDDTVCEVDVIALESDDLYLSESLEEEERKDSFESCCFFDRIGFFVCLRFWFSYRERLDIAHELCDFVVVDPKLFVLA